MKGVVIVTIHKFGEHYYNLKCSKRTKREANIIAKKLCAKGEVVKIMESRMPRSYIIWVKI